MNKILIDLHYLGCLEYFCILQKAEEVILEVWERFQKQSYRNRTYLLGANKVQSLIIPVSYSQGTLTRDVKIDYSQRWIKDHWGAFYSAYGKAPFFDFFADDFHKIWHKKAEFLLDINLEMLSLSMRLLDRKLEVKLTERYEKEPAEDILDLRDVIQPKNPFSSRNIYASTSYSQLFGNSFVPNLSIVDLIMCEGPQASGILASSYRGKW